MPAPLLRIRAYLGARLRAEALRGAPIAPMLTHAGLAALVCGLVRDGLDAWAYALVALALSAALIAIPLLGDLGYLLRFDAAAEWIEAQPMRRSELRWARALLLLCVLGALALSALLVAAAMAPGWSLAARAGLVAAGLGQALCVAAFLLLIQGWLAGRAETGLVLAQGALFALVATGLARGLRQLPELRELASSGQPLGGALAWLPPAWFAAPWHARAPLAWLPWAVAAGALALVIALPAPAPQRARRSASLLERALAPVRALAARAWVRAGERGAFDLVYDALPRERDFALRTYPLLGLPLGFLWLGARESSGEQREGLLALLLFSAGIYLPVLLAQVACSQSHAARWLLDTSRRSAEELREGALKAVAVRFLLPLFAGLALLAAWQIGPGFALRLVPLGAAFTWVVMRKLAPACIADPPLSVAPDELRAEFKWGELFLVLTVVVALAAVLSWRFASWWASLSILALVVALELAAARRAPAVEPA